MIETLYKRKAPLPTTWREEFFELTMGEQEVDGQAGYFVRETQCWWDARAQRTVRVQYTHSPREGFLTIGEARQCYQLLRMNRARRGFVHSFSPCYEPDKRNKYILIETEAKSEKTESDSPPASASA